MKFSSLLLAAGDSSRMGGKNKLMLKVEGVSLVRKTVRELNKISLTENIIITGHQAALLQNELQDLGTTFVQNDDFLVGMHTSIKRGLKSLQETPDAFFICLADQPYFDHQVLATLIEHFVPGKILVPTHEGKRGHPVLISSTFIPEILQEPDGDYGCSYLLKRHPESVKLVDVKQQGILLDVDEPQDYNRVIANTYQVQDPVQQFYAKVQELRETGTAFVIASVTEVMGSASAKTGSKAIFAADGTNILGWVGGGCAERFIGEESVAAIREGRSRVVLADLDDEIFGLGVACGGKMKVFIDPILPSELITLPHTDKFHTEVRSLSSFYGWNVKKDSAAKAPATIEELLLTLSKAVAQQRGKSHSPLKIVKKVPAQFRPFTIGKTKSVAILGRTRITEALARHFTLLNYDVRAIGPDLKPADYPSTVKCSCLDDGYGEVQFFADEMVVIAGHTSQDPALVKKAIDAGASYVGMIGSYKRSEEVLQYLGLMNQEVSAPLTVPAGLDIDAKNPDEIALSIVAEILMLKGQHL